MLIRTSLLLTQTTLMALLILLTACEGGKTKDPVACADGSGRVDYLGRCITGESPQCPSGQQRINGQCTTVGSQCGLGFHLHNGQCVPNTLDCPPDEHQVGEQCVANNLQVDIINQTACWNPNNGTTQLDVRYVTRDQQGMALDPEYDAAQLATAIESDLLVDGRPPSEAQVQRDAELLRSNLVMSLVLDASYSMLEHEPPAFEPMKNAAMELLTDVRDTWQANQSEFNWQLAWFSTYINRPSSSPNAWTIADIAHLPAPQPNDFTGLYKAVLHMLNEHRRLQDDENLATGERDQHVMVVLSDGRDNHSFFDNSSHQEQRETNNIQWTEMGSSPAEMGDIEVAAGFIPNLRMHVIGVGGDIDEQELLDLADLGRGQYFYGDDGAAVADIFNSVKQEFVTMQSIGLQGPLPPKTYEFTLQAHHLNSGARGQTQFTVEVNEDMGDCAP